MRIRELLIILSLIVNAFVCFVVPNSYANLAFDYDNDGIDDLSVWRPESSILYIVFSKNICIEGTLKHFHGCYKYFGEKNSVPVIGDYDNDNVSDMATWNREIGNWILADKNTFQQIKFGSSGDVPVQGDYNGNGQTDIAVWKPKTGNWSVKNMQTVQWGLPGDVPVPGDYNGDGKTDFAVWRPFEAVWYIKNVVKTQWGLPGDIPIPGDYDGDGKTDIAVWRPSDGNWYIKGIKIVQWGLPGDIPVPGDYDGDGKTDIAVWRPNEGNWYICGKQFYNNVSNQIIHDYNKDGVNDVCIQWGLNGDIPCNQNYSYIPPFKVANYRGVMVSPAVNANDLIDLCKWRANLVRWQFNWFRNEDNANIKDYRKWLNGQLNKLDSLIPVCNQSKIKVVIDLHSPPGGIDLKTHRVFRNETFKNEFINTWKQIACRYKGNNTILGYDLLNEPHCWIRNAWQELAQTTAENIRTIDANHDIIIELNWGSPLLTNWIKPLKNISNVVYSVHMYEPGEYTHQGVLSNFPNTGVKYPGIINGQRWNKNKLEQVLGSIRKFQTGNKAKIYIGEFSAVRWAPNAHQYLNDLIEIFEQYKWDWTYHAFREANCWSVEHDSNPQNQFPTTKLTKRKEVLLNYFNQNF